MKFLIAVLVCAICNGAHASRDELISSPFGGGQPYKVVLKTEAKDSDSTMGLFSRNGVDWSQLAAGEVLLDPKRGPVYQLLEIGRIDNRSPIAIVVGGRLQIFNVMSDSAKPGHFELGSELVEELGTGIKHALPLIEKADQIAIFQSEKTIADNHASQLILVSIRNGASGFTIALRLKKGDDHTVELAAPPMIVDRKFHAADQLAQIFRRNAAGEILIYSDLLQQSFLSRLKTSEFGDLQLLVDKLISDQIQCQESNTDFCNMNQLARWNVETGKAVYVDSLTKREALGPFDILLKWPVASGLPSVEIGHLNSQGPSKGATLAGRLKLNANGTIWHAKAGDSGPVIFAVEDEAYVAVLHSGRVGIAKLDTFFKGKLPKYIAVTAYIKNVDHKARLFLVVSGGPDKMAATRVGHTHLYVFDLDAENEIQRKAFERPLSEFFYQQSELHQRLMIKNQGGPVALDTMTPPTAEASHYIQARDENTPYQNLETETIKYLYPHASYYRKLGANLEYKEFKVKGGTESPDGLYLTKGNEEDFYPGILLTHSNKPRAKLAAESFDLLRQAQPIRSEKLGQVSAKVFALDPSGREGQHGFSLVIYLTIQNDGKTTQFAAAAPISARSSLFADLKELRLVTGLGPHSHELYLVGFTADGASFVLNMSVDKTLLIKRNGEVFEPFTPGATIGPDEFLQRIVHDREEGDLHFVLTPDISPNSSDFRVHTFSSARSTYPKREHGTKARTFAFGADLTSQFQSLSDESSLSWKVQPFREEKKDATSAKDLVKNQVFAQLQATLEAAADPKQPAARKVIIVPAELKKMAMRFVSESYFVKTKNEAPANSYFHRFNRGLGLYLFDVDRSSPEAFFENFEIMAERPNERSLLVADIEKLIGAGRPKSSESTSPFVLKIPAPGVKGVEYQDVSPHVIYLMTAGGPVPYEEFRKQVPAPRATTVLIGTQAEYEDLKSKAEMEMLAGVDKAFEVVRLPEPTLNSKIAMLNQTMNRPDLKALGFTFNASDIVKQDLTPEEAQRRVFEYAAVRLEALAQTQELNGFRSFMEFHNMFEEKLLTDSIVRSSRSIDRGFIERILKVQFNLALNLADLPPDDPRRLLSNEDAVFQLQKAGMLGEFALKAEVIRLTTAQLNHDPARSMPSTWIWAGEPGTGKTKAWQALVKMLNLKLFRKDDRQRSEANAFYLDTARVPKGNAAAIDEVIDDLNAFVTSPAGSTGFIFIDDLSFADNDLGKALVQWVRVLQQAERGVYRVKLEDGVHRSVSVQNLSIGIAMNFTDNQNALSQYKSDLSGKIVATGSRFGMDKSFVDRFGGVYNFDSFHESVKEPSLNKAVLEAAQKKMARSGQYILLDPTLVKQAAKSFAKMGARPFLSKTTDALISLPDELQMTRSKMFALIPKSEKEIAEQAKLTPQRTTGAWDQESGEVKTWVQSHTRAVELEDNLAARLMLMRLMVPSLRSPMFEAMVYAIQMDPRFKADRLAGSFFQSPALLAVLHHVARAESIPLKDLKIDNVKPEELDPLLEELSSGETPFVIPFPTTGGRLSIWPELGIGGQRPIEKETRRDVIVKYAPKIQAIIEKHLLHMTHLKDYSGLNDVDGWLRQLPEKIPARSEEMGRELSSLLFEFMREFQSPNLHEAQPSSNNKALEPYASTRFFLMAVDQAIIKLPWDMLSQKMISALRLISQDQALGQSIGVQNWLFNPEAGESLLKPTTANLIQEMVEFNPLVRQMSEQERANAGKEFESDCENYLSAAKRSP